MASTYPPLNPTLESSYGTTNPGTSEMGSASAPGHVPFSSFGGSDISSTSNYVPIVHPLQSLVIGTDSDNTFIPEGTLVGVQGLECGTCSLSAIHVNPSTVSPDSNFPMIVRPLAADLKVTAFYNPYNSQNEGEYLVAYANGVPPKKYLHYVSVAFGGVQNVCFTPTAVNILPGEKIYAEEDGDKYTISKDSSGEYLGKAMLQVYHNGEVGDAHAMVCLGV